MEGMISKEHSKHVATYDNMTFNEPSNRVLDIIPFFVPSTCIQILSTIMLPEIRWLEPQSNMWVQTTQISSSLPPKRDCGSKGVKSDTGDRYKHTRRHPAQTV